MESITIPARTVTARLGQARIIFGDDGNDQVFVHRNVDGRQESETDCAKGSDEDLCEAITAAGGKVTPEQLRAAFVAFGGRREPEEARAIAVGTFERRAIRKQAEADERARQAATTESAQSGKE